MRYQVILAPTKADIAEAVTRRDTDDRYEAIEGFVLAAAGINGYVALVADGVLERERMEERADEVLPNFIKRP